MGNSNRLYCHDASLKLCFIFEVKQRAEYIHFDFEQPEHADGTRSCRHLPDETLGGTETAPELFNTAKILLSALVSVLQLPR